MRALLRTAALFLLVASLAMAAPLTAPEVEQRVMERTWDLWCQGVPLEERTEEVEALRKELTPRPPEPVPVPSPVPSPHAEPVGILGEVRAALLARGWDGERLAMRLDVLGRMLERSPEWTERKLSDEMNVWRALPPERRYDLGDATLLGSLFRGITDLGDFRGQVVADRPLDDKIATLLTPSGLANLALEAPDPDRGTVARVRDRVPGCPFWARLRERIRQQIPATRAEIERRRDTLKRERRAGILIEIQHHNETLRNIEDRLTLQHSLACPFCGEPATGRPGRTPDRRAR
ncbi:MAG: hypothetical protein HY608_11905 [Planctomycetes bacterium]|nr:hypothetical protein [Planctomycetota bacterium]